MTKTITIKCPCGEIFRKENIPVNSSTKNARLKLTMKFLMEKFLVIENKARNFLYKVELQS